MEENANLFPEDYVISFLLAKAYIKNSLTRQDNAFNNIEFPELRLIRARAAQLVERLEKKFGCKKLADDLKIFDFC
jgi:hypothetical protein